MTFFPRTTIIITVVVAVLALAYFSLKKDKNDGNLKEVLVIGTSPDYPPFEFIKDEVITGFDIDFAKALGLKLGKNIEIKEMEFSALIAALNSNKVDMVISGLTKTPERSKNMSFSDPYYNSSFSIIVKTKSGIKSLDEISIRGLKIGVQTGTTMETFINKFSEENNASLEVVSLGSNFVLIEKLKLGEINAIIVEKSTAPDFVKNYSELEYFPIKENISTTGETSYVIGFKKDSVLVDMVNKGIEELSISGEIDELLRKWSLR